MAQHPSWNSVYKGSPPWDIGRPQPDFVRLADAGKFHGHMLDVGCGTGEHVMLAASHGAEAMGVDVAELAIERARAKAQQRGISAMFEVGDVLHLDRLRRQFDVITDSGVFHVFDDEERPVYVNSLRSALRPGGMYYLMCFSDRQPGDWGPRAGVAGRAARCLRGRLVDQVDRPREVRRLDRRQRRPSLARNYRTPLINSPRPLVGTGIGAGRRERRAYRTFGSKTPT